MNGMMDNLRANSVACGFVTDPFVAELKLVPPFASATLDIPQRRSSKTQVEVRFGATFVDLKLLKYL